MKTFYSMDEIEEYYFPKTYVEERRKREIEKRGIGVVLAEEFLERIKKNLTGDNHE